MTSVETHDAHLRQSDAFAWNMERDPLLRSTIVAVATFDQVPDWERLVDRLERATRLSPNFRRRLVSSPLKLAPPRFLFDPDFELGWHLRRLSAPAPHTLDTVLEFARTAGMAAFDPARPLWECTLIDGLVDGRSALVMKVHHSLTDGIGGIQIAQHIVDFQAEAADQGPMPAVPPSLREGLGPAALTGVIEALTWDLSNVVGVGLRRLAGLPGDAVRAARHPRDAVVGLVEDVRSIAGFVRPVISTRSPVMTERRLSWHYQILECSTAELKRAGHAAGGSLNDAFIGGVTGGLRRYHEEYARHVDRLRLTMPISLRTSADPEGGNRVTIVRFDVPVGIEDPAARMTEIGRICAHQRHEPAVAYSEAIAGVLNLAPTAVVGGMLKHVDFLASNVPGLSQTAWLAGAELQGFYAFGPTLGASANVTLMSYGDTCCVGVNVDTGAVADPDLFLDCLAEGFEEVLRVGGEHDEVRVGRQEPIDPD